MPLSKRWQYPYDFCLTLLSHRAVARVLVVAGPDVGAALSITTLYSVIDSYTFFLLTLGYPSILSLHSHLCHTDKRFSSIQDSGPTCDPLLGRGAQTARGGCNSCIVAEDALREEVASSIGFVLDALAFSDLGSRRGSTHNSMLLHT